MTRNESYLGDGLYASFDGYQIVLRAPREHGEHYVALEPAVYAALIRYAADIGWKLLESERERCVRSAREGAAKWLEEQQHRARQQKRERERDDGADQRPRIVPLRPQTSPKSPNKK